MIILYHTFGLVVNIFYNFIFLTRLYTRVPGCFCALNIGISLCAEQLIKLMLPGYLYLTYCGMNNIAGNKEVTPMTCYVTVG
jgi:hypothetical protein